MYSYTAKLQINNNHRNCTQLNSNKAYPSDTVRGIYSIDIQPIRKDAK